MRDVSTPAPGAGRSGQFAEVTVTGAEEYDLIAK
jgi:hypothetical protein